MKLRLALLIALAAAPAHAQTAFPTPVTGAANLVVLGCLNASSQAIPCPVGQTIMSGSTSVAVASDQSPIPVTNATGGNITVVLINPNTGLPSGTTQSPLVVAQAGSVQVSQCPANPISKKIPPLC